MSLAMSIARVSLFAFSGTFAFALPEPGVQLEKLLGEVNGSGWELRQSLPELNYAKRFLMTVTTTNLASADGRPFKIEIIDCPGDSIPGVNFMLIYLRNSAGKVVDWKSQWLSTRDGIIRSKVLDVNHDGVPDFCFLCERFGQPEQILAAYSVRNDTFDSVIFENTTHFHVEFEDTTLEPGLFIQTDLKGEFSWQADKLYEIPIKLVNRSTQPIDLRGRSICLSPRFYGSGVHDSFRKDTLQPGDQVETTITVRFSQGMPGRKFRFELTPKRDRR